MPIEPTYSGEIQFAGYSDSSRSGPRITLRLEDRDHLQSFVGKEGKRFMLVLVEIGDDEKPVQPEQPEAKKDRPGPLCMLAVRWCEDPEFWGFLTWQMGFPIQGEKNAKAAIFDACKLKESRKELDEDPTKGYMFHQAIRGPYMKWAQARGRATASEVSL